MSAEVPDQEIIYNVGFAPRYADGNIVPADRIPRAYVMGDRIRTYDRDAETLRLAAMYGDELPGLVQLMLEEEGLYESQPLDQAADDDEFKYAA